MLSDRAGGDVFFDVVVKAAGACYLGVLSCEVLWETLDLYSYVFEMLRPNITRKRKC